MPSFCICRRPLTITLKPYRSPSVSASRARSLGVQWFPGLICRLRANAWPAATAAPTFLPLSVAVRRAFVVKICTLVRSVFERRFERNCSNVHPPCPTPSITTLPVSSASIFDAASEVRKNASEPAPNSSAWRAAKAAALRTAFPSSELLSPRPTSNTRFGPLAG